MILLTNLAVTLLLTGLGWSLQLVQLPILLRGDYPELSRQLALHRRLNTQLMVAPMALEFLTAVWLASSAALIVALLLWVPVGYGTVWYSLLHRSLQKGYNKPAMDRMKRWNLVRTLGWTARAAVLLWVVARRF